MNNDRRILELALQGLEAERRRINKVRICKEATAEDAEDSEEKSRVV